MNLDLEKELELLIAISESIDEWAQPDYSVLSNNELRLLADYLENKNRERN